MSVIDLEVAKARLRVFGTHNDVDLQQALDGAEQEACRFMNRSKSSGVSSPRACISSTIGATEGS